MSVTYQTVGYLLPIPILTVRFCRLAEVAATDSYAAIVDTGADMTVAPAEILYRQSVRPPPPRVARSQGRDEYPPTYPSISA